MKFFKSGTGEVFAFEADGSQDAFIPQGLAPMTEAEVELHLNPAPSVDQQRSEILAELERIDAASARPLRSILVGSATEADHARLVELDARACTLRAALADLAPAQTL